jgi:hypothetical protein
MVATQVSIPEVLPEGKEDKNIVSLFVSIWTDFYQAYSVIQCLKNDP